jgi:uncharacterized protein YecE (DUF72 family)
LILIGTSGWVYKHWPGCFYPQDLRQPEWLPFFARRYPTVEINRSFYRLPSRENFEAWAEQVSPRPDFVFAVKASRYLTHLKRLRDPEEPMTRLLEAAYGLGSHLGPILFQLPPGMKADWERLRYFLSTLPAGIRAAVEFRHSSWYAPDILRLLDEQGCALVRAVGGYYTPEDVPDAGPFRYIRVHNGMYGVGLTEGELQHLADRIRHDANDGLDIYVYFNNDPGCHAIYNADRLCEILGL